MNVAVGATVLGLATDALPGFGIEEIRAQRYSAGVNEGAHSHHGADSR
jgi:hypothetical protein